MPHQTPTAGADVKLLTLGMLLYPGFTLLDLASPQAPLGDMNDEAIKIAKTRRARAVA